MYKTSLQNSLHQNKITNSSDIFSSVFPLGLWQKYAPCFFFFSVHYPPYSLNVASMYLKLGRLYLGLEKKTQGVKALKKVIFVSPHNIVL